MTNKGQGNVTKGMIVTDEQARAMIASGRVRAGINGRGQIALRVTHESARYGGGYVGYKLSGGRWYVESAQFKVDSPWRADIDAALVAAGIDRAAA